MLLKLTYLEKGALGLLGLRVVPVRPVAVNLVAVVVAEAEVQQICLPQMVLL